MKRASATSMANIVEIVKSIELYCIVLFVRENSEMGYVIYTVR